MKLILSHIYRFSSTLDFDECVNPETNDCHANALCNNTEGSYICRCRSGYQGNGTNCTGKYLVYCRIANVEEYAQLKVVTV